MGLLLWQMLGDPDSLIFPLPSKSIAALGGLPLWEATAATLRLMMVALPCAAVIGLALGALVGRVPTVERGLQPVIDFFRALPAPVTVAVVPLILGPNLRAAMVILVVVCVWPILLNTAEGMKAVPAVRLDMSRAMRLARRDRILKVIVPSLTPYVFIGLKTSVVIALVGAIYLEMVGVQRGLGNVLFDRQQRFDGAGVWGIVFVIGMLGYLVNVCLRAIEVLVVRRWPEFK